MDLSWHMHRNYSVFEGKIEVEVEGETIPSGHMFGVMRTIKSIRTSFPKAVIILCRDGIPIRRHEIMGDKITYEGDRIIIDRQNYKGNRTKLPYNIFKNEEDIIKMATNCPGVFCAYNKTEEADDVMFALSRQIHETSPEAIVYLYTGDGDLQQAIDSRTFIIKKLIRKGSKVQLDVLDEVSVATGKFSVEPQFLPMYRAIIGDSSDSLPGPCPRFPREFARYIAYNCLVPEDIKSLVVPDTFSESVKVRFKELLEAFDHLERNYKVMKLDVVDSTLYYFKDIEEAVSIAKKFKLYGVLKQYSDLGLIEERKL